MPLGYYNQSAYLEIDGQPVSQSSRRPFAPFNLVSPGYLQTMKPRLMAGRFVTPQDDEHGRPVAVINQFMAHRFWPNQDPLGKRFRSTDLRNEWLEVVGVVKDAKVQWIFADPQPFFYVPIAQHYMSLRTLQLRTAGDPAALAPLVEREIHAMDPDMPLFDATTMERTMEGPNGFFLLEMAALFGGGLGLLGLVLALVGVYGVVSYAASQRTQEIGVRMALGARRGEILSLVVRQAMALTIAGVAIGFVGAAFASRALETLLFGITRLDPVTYAGVVLVLLGASGLAAWVPAWRAARVDPSVTLRAE